VTTVDGLAGTAGLAVDSGAEVEAVAGTEVAVAEGVEGAAPPIAKGELVALDVA
jgi:hypothetical protein